MKLWDKFIKWWIKNIEGGYRPSDVQHMAMKDFEELCKKLDNAPKEPIMCPCYCPCYKKNWRNR